MYIVFCCFYIPHLNPGTACLSMHDEGKALIVSAIYRLMEKGFKMLPHLYSYTSQQELLTVSLEKEQFESSVG